MSNGKKMLLNTESLDKVVGGMMRGTTGNDTVYGTGDADLIYGLAGSDFISGGSGEDTVYGGAGNDTIIVAEVAHGEGGDDHLVGGRVAEQLLGGAGNDTLEGGGRDGVADYLDGGAGDDALHWTPGGGADVLQGADGQDTLHVTLSMGELNAALDVVGRYALTMHVDDKTVTFTDRDGNPATISGNITHGGETMRFSGIERIQIP